MPFRRTRRKPRARRANLSRRVNRLERNTRPEVKYKSTQTGGFATIGSNLGTLIQPQQLQQGTSRDTRIGDKVKSRNIRFQAILKMPDIPSNPTCAVRLLVLRSKFTEPSTSDMPEWYESVDEDKFFVVKDILTQVSVMQGVTTAGGSSSTGSTLKRIKFNIPTGLRKLQYDGSTNNSPLNNEYLIYMFAENQDAQVAFNWQHYYIDN